MRDHAALDGFIELGDDATLERQQERSVRSQVAKTRQERAGAPRNSLGVLPGPPGPSKAPQGHGQALVTPCAPEPMRLQ